MAVDTIEKRRSISGIGIPSLIPGVLPNSAKDQEWRQESGWSYSEAYVSFINTAEKRRSISGIWLPFIPGVTPNAAQDKEWRHESAWSYSFTFVFTFTDAGAPFLFTSANWSGVDFHLEVFMRSTSGTVEAQLHNVTDDTVVTGSNLLTTSISFVRLRSGALTLADGKEYRVQFGANGADAGEFLSGKLIGIQ